MSDADAAVDRAERATERLNRYLDFRVHREMRAYADEATEREEQRREQEEARRDCEQRHADACRRHAARYDGAFSQFGEQTPQRINGEYPGDFRRRLFTSLQRKLAPDHRLADARADEMSSSVISNFEQELLDAAQAEAEHPSRENLPRDGSMIERSRVDSRSGARTTTFYGRQSFIKAMGQTPRRVFAFHNRDGLAIWPPRAQAAGFTRQGLMKDL
jgi:hypothetical protein